MPDNAINFDQAEIEATRQRVIGERKPIEFIAAMNEETIRNSYGKVKKYNIPFIVVGGVRYIDPFEYAEMCAAHRRAAQRPLPPPRPVGRPRKSST